MSENIEGLVFGDFSELETEERAKIDHVLRDGSNAVELYWSLQDNGLPIPGAVPNGPSSLSPEEAARFEQQQQRDLDLAAAAAAAISASQAAAIPGHLPNTELSLIPDNSFVFRADTPPVGRDSPKGVPQGAASWVTPQPRVAMDNTQQQMHQLQMGQQHSPQQQQHSPQQQQQHPSQQQQQNYYPVPSNTVQQQTADIDTLRQFMQGFQPVGGVPQQQMDRSGNQNELVYNTYSASGYGGHTSPLEAAGGAGNNASQNKRRNKKKRPPNYYERNSNSNHETMTTTSSPVFQQQFLDSNSGGQIMDQQQQQQKQLQQHQLSENVNNNMHAGNIQQQQQQHPSFPHNVPFQQIPPDMVRHFLALQHQQLQQQQPYQQMVQHQQQQQAMTALSSLIQQGNLPIYAPMPQLPPHVLQAMGAQMAQSPNAAQAPVLPDTRVPPPMAPPTQEPKGPPPPGHGGPHHHHHNHPLPNMALTQPDMGQHHHHRRSVERQFHPHHAPLESAPTGGNHTSNEMMERNRPPAQVPEPSIQAPPPQGPPQQQPRQPSMNRELPNHVQPSPPNVPPMQMQNQQQPPMDLEPPPKVQAEENNRKGEAQLLQDTIEKITAEYEALNLGKFAKKDQGQVDPSSTVEKRTEGDSALNGETEATNDNAMYSSQNQSETCSAPRETNGSQERTVESPGVEVFSKQEPNTAAGGEASEKCRDPVLLNEEEAKPEINSKNGVPEGAVQVERPEAGSVIGPPAAPAAPSPATNSRQAAGTPPPPPGPTPSAPPKPAGAWGSKPAGAWADLFKNTETAVKSVVIYSDGQGAAGAVEGAAGGSEAGSKEATPDKPVTAAEDKAVKQLGDILLKHEVNHRPIPLQPRGLVNRGNWCYVNATLQALLACPPFYHLMKALPSFPVLSRGPTSTPVIDSLIDLVSEFGPMQPRNDKNDPKGKQSAKLSSKDIVPGAPFEPLGVYKMLHRINNTAEFKHGRQEDAEEFLSCVLNGLHDEMVAAVNVVTAKEEEVRANGDIGGVAGVDAGGADAQSGEGDDDQWEKVGPKNKSVVTRSAKISESPVAKIFGGQLRSILHQQGSKESATLEPFFALQLDVHNGNVCDVREALDALVSKESLQGYTCPKSKQEVEATRRIMLEELPPVLILHLKWFTYHKSGGLQKHTKPFNFDEKLEISKEVLSQNARAKYHQTQNRTYKLFAVVNHHGARAIGGHYTTFVYHPGLHGWVLLDDSIVKTVNLSQVLKLELPRVPYLLYYRRVDITS